MIAKTKKNFKTKKKFKNKNKNKNKKVIKKFFKLLIILLFAFAYIYLFLHFLKLKKTEQIKQQLEENLCNECLLSEFVQYPTQDCNLFRQTYNC